MGGDEKILERLKAYYEASNIPFKGDREKEKYRSSVERLIRSIRMDGTPDRIPVIVRGTFLVSSLYGLSPYEAMYDYEKTKEAFIRFHRDYDPDYAITPASIGSGKVFEALGYRQYRWPGHGVAKETGYQYVEQEYMKPEEYRDLIDDPSDFWIRKYLPRVFDSMKAFEKCQPFTDVWEIVNVSSFFIPFSDPSFADSFGRLIEAGKSALEWVKRIREVSVEIYSMGYPSIVGGTTKAPFDILGDTLRGTRGIMLDLYRRPDLVLEAVERLTPLAIKQGVRGVNATGIPLVFIPLHKGADGFMSDDQFRKFYWPTLLKTAYGLVEEGCVPYLFVEGSYNARLDYLKDLPPRSCICHFEKIDMQRARNLLRERVCIAGDVPSSLILKGRPEDVKDYCRNLIDRVGKESGFILAVGTSLDEGNPDNIKAMIEFAKDYGRL